MKQPSAFAGLKLTPSDTEEATLDQRLFAPRPSAQPVAAPAQPVSQERGKEVGRETAKEVGTEPSLPASHEGIQQFDLSARPIRKGSFLFTPEEWEALEDLKLDLRRKFDLDATKNDLARCALQHLLEDFRRLGDRSIAVRRLSSRRTR